MAKIKKYLLLALTVLTLVFGCFALASCAPADGNSSSSSTGTSDTGSSDTPVADTPTEGLAYAINEDGNTASVIGIGAATNTNIIIASTYNGLPVTAIRGYAFEECYNLTSVVIPDSVTTIGDYAFLGCYNLTSVIIGDGVTTIGEDAFDYCYRLMNITVNEDNQYYKSIDGNLYTKDGKTLVQYAIGKTATSFTIPDGVTTIGDYAFSGCNS
ncbi:MAG: leucine-rich repeat domain-containing protein [Clostridia bacterium]|nr:leucine-rich repeat domain-containing protein [Clostridia bacterium]